MPHCVTVILDPIIVERTARESDLLNMKSHNQSKCSSCWKTSPAFSCCEFLLQCSHGTLKSRCSTYPAATPINLFRSLRCEELERMQLHKFTKNRPVIVIAFNLSLTDQAEQPLHESETYITISPLFLNRFVFHPPPPPSQLLRHSNDFFFRETKDFFRISVEAAQKLNRSDVML